MKEPSQKIYYKIIFIVWISTTLLCFLIKGCADVLEFKQKKGFKFLNKEFVDKNKNETKPFNPAK